MKMFLAATAVGMAAVALMERLGLAARTSKGPRALGFGLMRGYGKHRLSERHCEVAIPLALAQERTSLAASCLALELQSQALARAPCLLSLVQVRQSLLWPKATLPQICRILERPACATWWMDRRYRLWLLTSAHQISGAKIR